LLQRHYILNLKEILYWYFTYKAGFTGTINRLPSECICGGHYCAGTGSWVVESGIYSHLVVVPCPVGCVLCQADV